MKLSKEVQIGIAVVLAAMVFWWGNSVFSNLPVFSPGHTYYADLTHTQGLVSGSAVDIHGVDVGSITDVTLRPTGPRVQFFVDRDVVLPHGSYALAGGPGLFSDARLAIVLGPAEAEPHQPGDVIPTRTQEDLLSQLNAQAPDMLSRADTVLAATTQIVTAANDLLRQPESDLRQTLTSIQISADALTALLTQGLGSLQAVAGNAEELSGTLITLVEDSLAQTTGTLNVVLARLDAYLTQLELTTSVLGEVLAKINRGQGSLGRMVNEDSLYVNVNASAAALRRILEKFEEDPDYFLDHLELIEIF
ncbi:MAG: MlaD family protein [Bacteroidota bacterium]|nr:MlaD family protein [Bacteroidota bacterium]